MKASTAPVGAVASTGIRGLDQLLHGGLPAERLHLIEGDPGTGKTTLALQFLLEGRRLGQSCLYVTLSETASELRAVAESHGWSLEGLQLYELKAPEGFGPEEQYTIYQPSEIELATMVKGMIEVMERTRPARIVLDSLSEMRLLARDPLRYRRQILSLKEYFSGRACTVLLLDDHTSASDDLQLRSIAHGVVLLEQTAFDFGRSRRRMRIIKLRGVPVVEGYHDFKIHRGGLQVYPQLEPEVVPCDVRAPIGTGLLELDSLLGGGLPWGTCTLVTGPSGVGKSTIAAQYAAAAASNVPASIYLFDERRATFLARCDSLGMDLSARVAAGRVTVDQIEPGDLSPGEFAHRVRDRVQENECRLVLIDSLNGYLQAIPTIQSPLVRMHELIAFLNDRGVATILVSTQQGIIGTTTTPVDITYLADAVMLLRYFEASGRLLKAVSVIKKRTGAHENSIRELVIGPDRVHVGAPLEQFRGVMTGVPEYFGGQQLLLPTDGPGT